ncbi:hypothetical protein JAAARDRAFT_143710 [Jaapia argillacea MUCL 33604]|uniref:Glutathione synthetase n=1 Tax=Jaapia argillacea MUCL 33604 TaxID=933084 RepID=A0A067PDX4_9AGAM|nr:hypothetical protein JAAARDRAFT_143710 [Jaapia argillacea MUCL 33604]
MDVPFLDRVMGQEEGVGKVDEFVGQLWRGWKQIRDEGTAQPLHLGLFRSDYLLHAPSKDVPTSLRQVEFNTISSSFGPLSERTATLHNYLRASTGYYDSSPYLKAENFPENRTTAGLAEGLAVAHAAYGVPDARILFVVQAGERNVFDQRWLEYQVLESHGIHVIRQTLDELAKSATLDIKSNVLRISSTTFKSYEIAVIYFRAGYTPSDFPTSAQYETRFLLERSRAIKCPSIPLQLAGGKKVQEVLTKPGVLEHFLADEGRWEGQTFSKDDLAELRASWMGMWGLDDDDAETSDSGAEAKETSGVRKAREQASSLVLKPQREGGGNNVYKSSIPPFLDHLPPRERQAWIAMELIVPPEGLGNYLIRAGSGSEGGVKADVVSELGIFGWALFGDPSVEVKEKEIGWLVRTKGKDSDEGGVAAGFSVLDSILLVDD